MLALLGFRAIESIALAGFAAFLRYLSVLSSEMTLWKISLAIKARQCAATVSFRQRLQLTCGAKANRQRTTWTRSLESFHPYISLGHRELESGFCLPTARASDLVLDAGVASHGPVHGE